MSILDTFRKAREWASKAFVQIVIAAIMAFMVVSILITVMLPVLSGIITATPVITSGPLNTTQQSLQTTIGSSFGLLIIVLLLLAALAIIIVIGLFQYFVGGMSTRQ